MQLSFAIWIVSSNLIHAHFLVLKQKVKKLSIKKVVSSNPTEAQKTSYPTKQAYSVVLFSIKITWEYQNIRRLTFIDIDNQMRSTQILLRLALIEQFLGIIILFLQFKVSQKFNFLSHLPRIVDVLLLSIVYCNQQYK